MAFTYIGNSSAVATSAGEIDGARPAGISTGNLIIAVFGFENVAAGSGPWIVPNIGQLSSNYIGPSQGWQQVCWQSPSGTGVGIEVWGAIHGSGSNQFALFASTQSAVMASAAWSGELNAGNPIGNQTVRLEPTAQVTGNFPPAPSVTANSGELVIAIGGDLMTAATFGTPSGFTSRIDAVRGAAGTVEAVIADATITSPGATGPITFPQNAAATTTLGSTATLAIRPAPTTAGSGGLLEAPMPEDLDLGAGYTLRVTALDQATGAQVSGVNVTNVIVTGTSMVAGDGSGLVTGDWFLVPGPNA